MEQTGPAKLDKAGGALGLLRIALGFVFLWAFLDKAFGLGHETAKRDAWVNGGSPTNGFLEFGASGPFKETFNAMAGSVLVEWLFMLGLLGIGLALVLGIGVRIAAYTGSLLLLLMYLALLPPENNPVLDDHIVYAIALLALAFAHAGRFRGLGRWWAAQPLVRKHPILE